VVASELTTWRRSRRRRSRRRLSIIRGKCYFPPHSLTLASLAGWSNYNKTVLYMSYDVTDILLLHITTNTTDRSGGGDGTWMTTKQHVIEVILGNGK